MPDVPVERIKQFIDYKGINVSSFEKRIGYSNGAFASQLKTKKSIGVDKLENILNEFTDLDANWVLTGRGSMLKTDEGQPVDIQSMNLSKEELYRLTNYKPSSLKNLVPYYGVDFTAGNAVATFDDQTIEPEYYMDIPDFKGCKAFRAYSDSMEPAIKGGSILFGTKLGDVASAEFGQVYGIILNDGRRMLKYLRRHPQDPKNYFVLSSENKVYDDMEIAKESVKSLWLIHGYLSKRI